MQLNPSSNQHKTTKIEADCYVICCINFSNSQPAPIKLLEFRFIVFISINPQLDISPIETHNKDFLYQSVLLWIKNISFSEYSLDTLITQLIFIRKLPSNIRNILVKVFLQKPLIINGVLVGISAATKTSCNNSHLKSRAM